MAGDLFSHVQALLTAQPPTTTSQDGWANLIRQLESLDQHSTTDQPNGTQLPAPLPPAASLPTLLDYYTLPKSSGAGYATARVDLAVELPASAGPSAAVSSLMSRLKSQVSEPTSLQALADLLSSSRSSDDIQGAVLDTIGYEGDGFEIAADVLKPSNRPEIAALLQPSRPTPAAAPSTNNGPVPLDNNISHHFISNPPIGFTPEAAAARIQAELEANASRPLWTGTNVFKEEEVYPHVYTAQSSSASKMSYGGRFALPLGTIRKQEDNAEEVIIPPSVPVPPKINERIIPVRELGPLAAGCFPGYTELNRVQSIVQPVAMGTNENMLVCAPTGAGKTDIAIMSILRVLQQHVRESATLPYGPNSIDRNAFKVIYVAPMKALAAEITRKFAKRLAWLGILVRELTGDMQLTKKEINETQIIITTPEKWDVVTRKPTGEGELVSKVRLLIIDEVHLLNEDRGAVIETIVARTLRLVESSQSVIRIVGLSATLPNYIDVSDFLRVNRYKGLFFFDSSFRPVPLEQHFIGVKGKVRSEQSKRNMDQAVFDKVSEMLALGHQVMVFVHARKETVKTAEKLKEMAMAEGASEDFDPRDHPQFDFFRREIGTSRNKEMKTLFDYGFGIHHAGMLRSDRNMMERMFEANCIKVLCCTATLAWGVNLPAHAVIIKGTQVYDAGKGSFVDLSILDVLQIFGRAGRPGYSSSGVGYICTTQDKLDHYLDAVLSQHPIESQFVPGMVDSLNAEISLGTISNVPEAIEWLGYTYLFVRMKRNPFNYGMAHDETAEDPNLGNKRKALVRTTAKLLADLRMIEFMEIDQTLRITDLGRVAAKYYLKHETIAVFNKEFKPKLTEADTLALLSLSTEFDQIQVRENEVEELKALMNDVIPCQVKGGTDTSAGKVNILLQAYICGANVEDFALVSDMAYVAQNAARIIRSLLEMALARHWANAASVLASMSKSIEKRLWSYQNPLKQSRLQPMVLHSLEQWADEYSPDELAAMSADDIGKLVHLNEKHGAAILAVARQFPNLGFTYKLRPLSEDLLQVDVQLSRNFIWNQNLHGYSEPFYVWVEDQTGLNIFQWQHVLFRPTTSAVELQFIIPIGADRPNMITAKLLSDRWIGAEQSVEIALGDLVMPPKPQNHTSLIKDLPYLPVKTSIEDVKVQRAISDRFTVFNSIQTQAFWSLRHTDENVLVAAPNASGKSTISDIATLRSVSQNPSGRVLYICSSRQSMHSTIDRLRAIPFSDASVRPRKCLTPDEFAEYEQTTPSIGVTLPAALLDHVLRSPTFLQGISLVILDDLHLLDDVYELVASLVIGESLRSPIRLVGLSGALHDAEDLANWLGVSGYSMYSFTPKDRGRSVQTTTQAYSLPHSATLMRAMVKPVYTACMDGVEGLAIVFVPSPGQCRSIANDLVTQSGTEMDLKGFLGDRTEREDIEPLARRLRDQSWVEPMLHGIGCFYEGMHSADLGMMLELFAAGIIRVLITPRESCWRLPVQAGTVVVMGAQYLELQSKGDAFKASSDRKLRSYSLQELVQMQGFAAKPPTSAAMLKKAGKEAGKFILMCQSEQVAAYRRFLDDGLPLESSLIDTLRRTSSPRAISAIEKILGEEPKRQDLMDLLSKSLLWLRMGTNPTYYETKTGSQAESLSRLVDEFFAGHYAAIKAQGPKGKGKENGKIKEPIAEGDPSPEKVQPDEVKQAEEQVNAEEDAVAADESK